MRPQPTQDAWDTTPRGDWLVLWAHELHTASPRELVRAAWACAKAACDEAGPTLTLVESWLAGHSVDSAALERLAVQSRDGTGAAPLPEPAEKLLFAAARAAAAETEESAPWLCREFDLEAVRYAADAITAVIGWGAFCGAPSAWTRGDTGDVVRAILPRPAFTPHGRPVGS